MTKEYENFHLVRDTEADKYIKNEPKITWKHDKKYLTAYRDGKETPYFIEKNKCLTKLSQFVWIEHMGSKSWVNSYEFTKAFVLALKDWDLWEI